MVRDVLHDLRYAARMLLKNPGFTAIAVLTLALGIGANSAIFSVANAVIIQPLPFHEPSRLVTVLETKASQNLDWLFVTGNNFIQWQRRADSFEHIAALQGCGYRLAQEGEPQLVQGNCVSASFFPMLGVQPIIGRVWSPEEDQVGRDRVTLISHDFWQTKFGGDKEVVGKTIWRTIDRQPFTIIGVLPPDFKFARDDIQVWTPLALEPGSPRQLGHLLMVYARLKPGVSIDQAQASMTGLATQLEREFPATNTGWGVTVDPLQRFYSDLGNTRTTLLVLLGAVGLLLLIACANIANLLLARASARQREIAVRVAIGATRGRLIRQFLTESVLLGLLGGAGGFILAWVSFGPLLSLTPTIPSFRPHALGIDSQVFLFSMGVSLFASVLFGLTPALRVSKREISEHLREAGRGTKGTVRNRLTRNALVVSEIALAIVLLVGTGLLVKSLHNLKNDRLGFNSADVLTMGMCCLNNARYPTQKEVNTFYKQLFDRLQTLPDVEAVAITTGLPQRQFDGAGSVIQVRSLPPSEPGHETVADPRLVGPDYFHTMGIPLARGRGFTVQDDDEHLAVAVINESMARRYFPDQDPIGQQFQMVNLQPAGRWFTIVGLAKDSRDRGLGRETRSTFYLSYLQTTIRGGALLVRTKPGTQPPVAGVRDAVRSLNQDVTLNDAKTLDAIIGESLSPERFSATLLTLFAVLAICLASVGVYGVVAYTVVQRTHEIGVRMALGAQRRDIMTLVLGQGIRLALAGVALGLIGALASTRLLSTLLFGVSPYDPLTLIAVPFALTLVALLACYIPARRATKVDPLVALRYE
ncbi:MAG: ABC transporter permease [Acidobacteriota bacterium]